MDDARFERRPWREGFRRAPGASLQDARIVSPAGVLADRVRVADTPLGRLRGLVGREPLEASDALMIAPCAQVHTVGLRYPIDAVFCDRDLVVLGVWTLEPRRLTRHVSGAACCIELAAGRARECGVEPGVRLRIEHRSEAG